MPDVTDASEGKFEAELDVDAAEAETDDDVDEWLLLLLGL